MESHFPEAWAHRDLCFHQRESSAAPSLRVFISSALFSGEQNFSKMKKGFLCSPAAQQKEAGKVEEVVAADKGAVKEGVTEVKGAVARPTGAVPKVKEVPKVKVDLGKKRRRTRSKGSSLSPSPGKRLHDWHPDEPMMGYKYTLRVECSKPMQRSLFHE